MSRLKHLIFLFMFFLTACTGNGDIAAIPKSSQTETRVPSATQTLTPIPPTRTPMPTRTNTLTPTSTPGPSPTPAPPTPIPNTIYLVKYQNQIGIFVTSKWILSYIDDSEISLEYGGYLFTENKRYFEINFLDLDNPRELFTELEEVFDVVEYSVDIKSQTSYLSLVLIGSYWSMYNNLYKIKFDTVESDVIWGKEIGDKPYKEYWGPALIEQVSGPILELELLPCFQCSPCPPHGVLILNTENGAEKFVGEVGNVTINLDENTFSYQFLSIVEDNPAYECSLFFEPQGPIYTESLPQWYHHPTKSPPE